MAPDLKDIIKHYPEITGVHAAADIFPMLPEQEFLELCADIKERGLAQPITLGRNGELLDGRNRLLACYETNQEVLLDRYEGRDPVQFSLSANLHRRHLNQGQKAMVALKVEEIFAAEAKDRQGQRTDLVGGHQNIVANLPQCQELDPIAANSSSSMDNTLLGRCTVAYQEGLNGIDYPSHTERAMRAGVAEVLLHLAAEITVLRQNEPRMTAHEISTWLVQQVEQEVV